MSIENVKKRAAGLLMHISSLPGREAVGTMGESAYRFVDFLAKAKMNYWQVLPLVHTGFKDSPYQSVFGGSGNPYFIDLFQLQAEGLLTQKEVSRCYKSGETDYGFLYEKKFEALRNAYSRFDCKNDEFVKFVSLKEFHDYALFMSLKNFHRGKPFVCWEKKYRDRDPVFLQEFCLEHEREYLFWIFVQFCFFKQWKRLKEYANGKGIRIIGDLPLYVAEDSADVWVNRNLFKLTKSGKPYKVAGVPPDCFSETGQLWGNPVYNWKEHEKENFAWWTDRMRRAFLLYDVVRIDHFRGFDRYFEIDAKAENAINGHWVQGPKEKLFKVIESRLGKSDFIAEDLGTLDKGVYRLMKKTGYPGMKVLQFAFDGNPQNPYLPENIGENSICYTGTHDNDTLIGFLKKSNLSEIQPRIKEAVLKEGINQRISGVKNCAGALIECAFACRSRLTVLPVQDVMFLDNEARMNTPSTAEGNWTFRLSRLPSEKTADYLRGLAEKYGRA